MQGADDINWYLNVCFLKSPNINKYISVIYSNYYFYYPQISLLILAYCLSNKLSKNSRLITLKIFNVNIIVLFDCISVAKLSL